MEQHAIPQQISSYEFKLVGEMTLKQFLKAAVGIILAIVVNSTKLILIVKWPLMLILGGGGLLLAFVPFEDRPLEVWFLAFIKSIYAPTIYIYKKKKNENWLDLSDTKSNDSMVVSAKKEEKSIKFDSPHTQSKNGHMKLGDYLQISSLKPIKKEDKSINNEEVVIETKDVKEKIENEQNNILVTETKKPVSIEETKKDDWRSEQSQLNLKSEKLEATGKILFGSIPMPDIPETPNVIVGMATSNEGKIVEGVIVEIQDEHGNPSRVLKTNSLGQFKTSTPLSNGKYLIIAEKDSFTFDRVSLELNGQIVKPIKIIARN